MYGFEEQTPRGCKECKEFVRIQKTYEDVRNARNT